MIQAGINTTKIASLIASAKQRIVFHAALYSRFAESPGMVSALHVALERTRGDSRFQGLHCISLDAATIPGLPPAPAPVTMAPQNATDLPSADETAGSGGSACLHTAMARTEGQPYEQTRLTTNLSNNSMADQTVDLAINQISDPSAGQTPCQAVSTALPHESPDWAQTFFAMLRPQATPEELSREFAVSHTFIEQLARTYKGQVCHYITRSMPYAPLLIIDGLILCGHYLHGSITAPEGFWFTLTAPVEFLFSCARTNSPPTDPQLRAAYRFITECHHAMRGTLFSSADTPDNFRNLRHTDYSFRDLSRVI